MVYKSYLPLISNGSERAATTPQCLLSSDEQLFFSLVATHPNQTRPQITCSDVLQESTRYKAQDMIINNYIQHTSPTGETPNDVINKFGCNFPHGRGNFVETIFVGSGDPNRAFMALMNSPLHSAHLLGTNEFFRQFTQMGVSLEIGNNNFYWVVHIANCR